MKIMAEEQLADLGSALLRTQQRPALCDLVSAAGCPVIATCSREVCVCVVACHIRMCARVQKYTQSFGACSVIA